MVKNEQGAMYISKEQNGPSVLGSVWLGGNGPIGHIVKKRLLERICILVKYD